MNDLQINFSQLDIFINVALRIVTAIIFLFSIIPLQIKENKVSNGLKILRRQLLVSGLLLFSINSIGLIVIIFRYVLGNELVQTATRGIALFNTIGFLIVAIITYRIYHQQYSITSKKVHKRIENIEKKQGVKN